MVMGAIKHNLLQFNYKSLNRCLLRQMNVFFLLFIFQFVCRFSAHFHLSCCLCRGWVVNFPYSNVIVNCITPRSYTELTRWIPSIDFRFKDTIAHLDCIICTLVDRLSTFDVLQKKNADEGRERKMLKE